MYDVHASHAVGKPHTLDVIVKCYYLIIRHFYKKVAQIYAYVFKTLDEVREKTQKWMYDYNHHRPHKSLGYKTPIELLH